jgi:two-component system, response regulator / RNA-binding antiterminator
MGATHACRLARGLHRPAARAGAGRRGLQIILLDENEQRIETVRQGLAAAGHELVATIGPRDDLLGELERRRADLVIASMSSPDRDTLESLRSVSDRNPKPIVMFVDDTDAAATADAIRAGVSAYVVRGLAAERVKPVLDVAVARFRAFQELREEVARSRTALEERKLVERAKGLLMRQRGLGEEEAYRLLRKAAMDQNQRIVDIARSVLAVAEMLKP